MTTEELFKQHPLPFSTERGFDFVLDANKSAVCMAGSFEKAEQIASHFNAHPALTKENQELKERVKELEGALRDLNEAHEAFYIDWARINRNSPDYDATYRPEYPKESLKARELLTQPALKGGQ